MQPAGYLSFFPNSMFPLVAVKVPLQIDDVVDVAILCRFLCTNSSSFLVNYWHLVNELWTEMKPSWQQNDLHI